jgi:sterol desaturase/sphingolipid hydroxylase (fatty acid hydroxylase superfamily)
MNDNSLSEIASTLTDRKIALEAAALSGALIWNIVFSLVLLGALCATAYLVLGHRVMAVANQLIFISGYLLLAGLERILPNSGPRKSAIRWWLHLQLLFFSLLVGVLVNRLLLVYVAPTVAKGLRLKLGMVDLSIVTSSGWLSLFGSSLAAVIAFDFFYYWFHRACHKSSVLWQHHKMHHMDPEFDVVTAMRNNWLEEILVGVMIFIPFAILFKVGNLSYENAGFAGTLVLYILLLSRHINHCSLRIQFGKASCLWTSSQTHRIHHSYLPEHHDKNFAAFFPLWDVMFRTYYAPKWNEWPPTGVRGEKEIESFWEAQVFTFRQWAKMYRAWRRRRVATDTCIS